MLLSLSLTDVHPCWLGSRTTLVWDCCDTHKMPLAGRNVPQSIAFLLSLFLPPSLPL